ncbi:Armadillo-Like Helical Domain-Containing Protein 3 [Manis pentadactyla]|nr:Armadillo-Like Helical Domain-Containing Protein 3 [Manis pentadactyla]
MRRQATPPGVESFSFYNRQSATEQDVSTAPHFPPRRLGKHPCKPNPKGDSASEAPAPGRLGVGPGLRAGNSPVSPAATQPFGPGNTIPSEDQRWTVPHPPEADLQIALLGLCSKNHLNLGSTDNPQCHPQAGCFTATLLVKDGKDQLLIKDRHTPSFPEDSGKHSFPLSCTVTLLQGPSTPLDRKRNHCYVV